MNKTILYEHIPGVSYCSSLVGNTREYKTICLYFVVFRSIWLMVNNENKKYS